MKTKAELEQFILNITMKIHSEFPELSKYISEMPEGDSGTTSSENTIKNLKTYYISLVELVSEYAKTHDAALGFSTEETTDLSGYPKYGTSEDIYTQEEKLIDVDPENSTKKKSPIDIDLIANEKSFAQDMSGKDLDVPGSELDDEQERIGSEDEENNYYSLGGDKHDD